MDPRIGTVVAQIVTIVPQIEAIVAQTVRIVAQIVTCVTLNVEIANCCKHVYKCCSNRGDGSKDRCGRMANNATLFSKVPTTRQSAFSASARTASPRSMCSRLGSCHAFISKCMMSVICHILSPATRCPMSTICYVAQLSNGACA